MKKILIIISCLFLLSNFIIFQPCSAVSSFDEGLKKTAEGTGHKDLPTPWNNPENLPQAIGKVIGAVLAFLGVIFLVLMIYGGYLWMMARGNEQEVEKAKNIIQNGLIGIVIVLVAYIITILVGSI